MPSHFLWVLYHLYLFQRLFVGAIRDFQSQTLQLPQYQDPGLVLPLNSSGPGLNVTTLDNSLQIECDGSQYGLNPDFADCESALNTFRRGRNRITFAERGPNFPRGMFPLPYRWMGSMHPDNLP